MSERSYFRELYVRRVCREAGERLSAQRTQRDARALQLGGDGRPSVVVQLAADAAYHRRERGEPCATRIGDGVRLQNSVPMVAQKTQPVVKFHASPTGEKAMPGDAPGVRKIRVKRR